MKNPRCEYLNIHFGNSITRFEIIFSKSMRQDRCPRIKPRRLFHDNHLPKGPLS